MSLMRKIKLNPTKAVLMAYIIKNNIYDMLWRQVSYKIRTLYKKEKSFHCLLICKIVKTCEQGETNCLEMNVFMCKQVNSYS